MADYTYTQLEWPSDVEFRKVDTHEGVKVTGYVGGGLKIHFPGGFSLRVEIRNMMFWDDYDAESASSGTGIQPSRIKDMTNITLMRLGVCYSFF